LHRHKVRMKGANGMGKNRLDRIIDTGNVVEESMQGNVKIRIFDSAYVDKTQEDTNKILERIADIAFGIALRKEH
jgi:ABC-type transport system involved in cytochrome c biogenesis ATPase subunit